MPARPLDSWEGSCRIQAAERPAWAKRSSFATAMPPPVPTQPGYSKDEKNFWCRRNRTFGLCDSFRFRSDSLIERRLRLVPTDVLSSEFGRHFTDIVSLPNGRFAPKTAIPPKVGFGALDDLATPKAEAMLSSLIATKHVLATRIAVGILAARKLGPLCSSRLHSDPA